MSCLCEASSKNRGTRAKFREACIDARSATDDYPITFERQEKQCSKPQALPDRPFSHTLATKTCKLRTQRTARDVGVATERASASFVSARRRVAGLTECTRRALKRYDTLARPKITTAFHVRFTLQEQANYVDPPPLHVR